MGTELPQKAQGSSEPSQDNQSSDVKNYNSINYDYCFLCLSHNTSAFTRHHSDTS